VRIPAIALHNVEVDVLAVVRNNGGVVLIVDVEEAVGSPAVRAVLLIAGYSG